MRSLKFREHKNKNVEVYVMKKKKKCFIVFGCFGECAVVIAASYAFTMNNSSNLYGCAVLSMKKFSSPKPEFCNFAFLLCTKRSTNVLFYAFYLLFSSRCL